MLLNRAAWLGKGARPAGRVEVPVIAAAPPSPAAPAAEERAAKEKTSRKKCRSQARQWSRSHNSSSQQ